MLSPRGTGEWSMPNASVTGTRVASHPRSRRATWLAERVWPTDTGKAGFSGIAAATPIVGQGTCSSRISTATCRHWRWSTGINSGERGSSGVARPERSHDGQRHGFREHGRDHVRARCPNWTPCLGNAPHDMRQPDRDRTGRRERQARADESTGQAPGGRGILFALDAVTGRVRWRFDTIRSPWQYPAVARGGGAWQTPTVDSNGDVYWGTANPYPWGGTPQRPERGRVPRRRPLHGLPRRPLGTHGQPPLGRSGDAARHSGLRLPAPTDPRPRWRARRRRGRRQGRAGDRLGPLPRRRLWETAVGLRRNDVGPLPAKPVTVCPGLLGGVETPMARSGGRVFVPVVDLCFREGSHGPEGLDFFRVDYSKGKGELVALDARSGRRLWTRKFPSPNFGCATVANDVVFTATYDGTIYGLSVADGRTLWKATARAGSTPAPPSQGARCSSSPAPTTPLSSRPCSSWKRSACRDERHNGGRRLRPARRARR